MSEKNINEEIKETPEILGENSEILDESEGKAAEGAVEADCEADVNTDENENKAAGGVICEDIPSDAENEDKAADDESEADAGEKKAGILSAATASLKTKSFKLGMKSSVITAVVVVAVIIINILACHLPGSLNNIDITPGDIFSIGEQTKAMLDTLDEDITIRVLSEESSSDENLNYLLKSYKDASKHISIEYVDMNTDLTASDQYGSYSANSVVVCGENREVAVDYYDIYQQDYSQYYTTGSVFTSFDGEGSITSAIYKVTSDSTPMIYTLTGHGETALGSSVLSMISKQNMMTQDLSLMAGDIPEDCSAVIINGPVVDLAEEEAKKLSSYMAGGGSVMILLSYNENKLSNLEALMNENGVSTVDGIAMETSGHCFNYQINVLAGIPVTDLTQELASSSANILMTYAIGLKTQEDSDRVITPLLESSDGAYSKIPSGGQLQTLEKENGDIDGPFSFAVLSENESTSGSMVVISSETLIDEAILQYPVGNLELFMNCLTKLGGDDESAVSVSIEPKSMDVEYLAIPALHGMVWMFVSILLIPLAILIAGFVVWLIRRKK